MFNLLNRQKTFSFSLIFIGALMLLFRLENYHLDLFLIYGAVVFLVSFFDTRKAYPLGVSFILLGYEILNIFNLVGEKNSAHAYLSILFLIVGVLLVINCFKPYLAKGEEMKTRLMEWGFLFFTFAVVGFLYNFNCDYTMWIFAILMFLLQVMHYFLGNKQIKNLIIGLSFIAFVLIERLTAWLLINVVGNALLLIIPGALLGIGVYMLFGKNKINNM